MGCISKGRSMPLIQRSAQSNARFSLRQPFFQATVWAIGEGIGRTKISDVWIGFDRRFIFTGLERNRRF